MPGRVSVVVPTRNSESTIAACLESARAQTHRDVELIVVDNYSVDRTVEIAGQKADRVITKGPERSAQRNAGASAATGDWLVFIDSDMILPPRVAEEIAHTFSADPVDALVLPERSIGEGLWARCKAVEKELYLGHPDVEAARAFTRAVFRELGGYDERIVAGGEEWDLPERIRQRGGRVGRISTVVIHDEGRLKLIENLRKKFYYGRGLTRYVQAQPRNAARKLARWQLLGAVRLLPRSPALVLALFALKLLETIAVLAGMVVGKLVRHPSERGMQPYRPRP